MADGFSKMRKKGSYNSTLDFFDISAIEPNNIHKESFHIQNEELNTEESSLRTTRKQAYSNEKIEIAKVEQELVNLTKRLRVK